MAFALVLAGVLASALTPASGLSLPSSLCFEKLWDQEALYLQEHPLRGRAVVAKQNGMMTLISLPPLGSRTPSRKLSTWLDLTDRVKRSDETGLLSFAFHPLFARNGRFFVSYTCDSQKHHDCQSMCGCNKGVGCTVGEKNAGCSSTTIVAEYTAGKKPLRAVSLVPREVRRIIGFARPYGNHNGGHIFFGKDGFLYLTSGDGGSQDDPWNLAQNGRSFFGKILRLDVNKRQGRLNFSVPWNNPWRGKRQNNLMYALGLRNPWRCDIDPVSSLFVCGDVGGSQVEEVNIIGPGRNYEWVNFEGTHHHKNSKNLRSLLGAPTGPVFRYTHDSLGGLGCIIGGVFYRNQRANKCLYGRYIYGDHSGPLWVAAIRGKRKTQRVRFTCARSSPLSCPPGGMGDDTEWGGILSFARDRSNNVYLLTETGIYRITLQKKCGFKC